MRRSAGLFAVLALAACRAGPPGSIYQFRPGRVAVGTVFHYLKTNLDGSHPEHIAVYLADTSRVEVYKYNPGTDRAGFVVATMDWRRFVASRLESWQVPAGAPRLLFATMIYDSASGMVEAAIPALHRGPERLRVDSLPFHVYNFDLTSLNVTLPHLRHPAETFSIRLLDPTFTDPGPIFRDRGVVTLRYVRAELRNDLPCRVYTIGGPGLDDQEGLIWVNEETGYIEDLEIPVPDNPEWTTFKLRLESRETMTPADWLSFQSGQLAPSTR